MPWSAFPAIQVHKNVKHSTGQYCRQFPKKINMARNFAGSPASKALQMNNSLQVSAEKKVESITGHSQSPKPARYLRATLKRSVQHKTYQNTALFKTRHEIIEQRWSTSNTCTELQANTKRSTRRVNWMSLRNQNSASTKHYNTYSLS